MSLKVLVVDDDTNIRQTLLFVLDPVCEVLEACDGEEALRLIRLKKPSLVLLDVSMPGLGGLAVLKAARRIDPDLAVVMLTSLSNLTVAKLALDAGARAYMTKPFNSKLLREQIAGLLAELAVPAETETPWRVRP